MFTKYIIILLYCCVHNVYSITTFIDKGQRAELFELIDNEMPTIKVNMPDEEFFDFKIKAVKDSININDDIMPKMQISVMNFFSEIQKINFIETFPEYNFKDMFPQLQINETGYAKFDIEKVTNGFDYDSDHYVDDIGDLNIFLNHFFKTNENFNLFEIIDTVKKIDNSEINDNDGIDYKFKSIDYYFNSLFDNLLFNVTSSMVSIKTDIKNKINLYKLVNFTEIYPEYDFNENIPEFQIGKDGYAKYNVDKVFAGFNFDQEYYKSLEIKYYDDFKSMILGSNKNFNLYEIEEKLEELEFYDKILRIIESSDDSISESLKNLISYETVNDDSTKIFKTKNATMSFELNGIKKSFKKVTFSLGGQYSRSFSKPHYNLKIRGGKELYGRSQFKLRSDAIEPTYLRTKLVSDIHNRLGLKSLSAGYTQLYINDEFMGLYIITDSLHLSWVERTYGEKDTASLYECQRNPYYEKVYQCTNKNDKIPDEIKDKTEAELDDFREKMKNSKSAADLEDIFDIEHFLYEMALEYLLYGWDHIVNGRNFFFYKQPNGKWIYLTQDFDQDFGQRDGATFNYTIEEFLDCKQLSIAVDPTEMPNFESSIHITDVLILQNPQRFNEILKDVVQKVFNPSTLYPHIDELKQFIKPYVQIDKTPDSNGIYPGTINKNNNYYFTMEQWDAYSEFTTGNEAYNDYSEFTPGKALKNGEISYGLKYWILMKYRSVCKNYKMECDSTYLDEHYEYPVNKEVEFVYDDEYGNPIESMTEGLVENPTENPSEYITENSFENLTDDLFEQTTKISIETLTESSDGIFIETPTEISTESFIEKPTEISTESFIKNPIETSTESFIEKPTVTSTKSSINKPTVTSTKSSINKPTVTSTKSSINKPTVTTTEHSTTLTSSEPFIEKETVYDVDEPTASTDDESSFEEETESSVSNTKNTTTKITITKTVYYTKI